MSRKFHQDRHIRIHGVRKDPPDLRRLARALIELARQESEDGEREAEGTEPTVPRRSKAPKPKKNDSGDAA
jgi:hypothetical protein